MKLALVGPSGAGKDLAAEILTRLTPLRYWGPTSSVICRPAAQWLGISEAEAYATRHAHRDLWRQIGDELRRDDDAHLAREVLRHGDICVGIRARCEMVAAQREELVDLTVWVDRDVDVDSTLEYGQELADIVLPNREGVAELEGRLRRLAGSWGLLGSRQSSALPAPVVPALPVLPPAAPRWEDEPKANWGTEGLRAEFRERLYGPPR